MSADEKPRGRLAIRTLAMPAFTNIEGDIFGGWVVSQMDLAGLSFVRQHTKNRAVTVAINAMQFIAPIHVGDFICCYTDLEKIGNTSISINIQTWAVGSYGDEVKRKVTEGVFTFVAIDENQKPTPIIKRKL